MATLVDERALDERLAQLEAARSWSPRVVSRLESLIRDGDDAALFRVNPFALSAERGLDPVEATDLMLHATAQGLFDMDWLLICPRCACAVESFAKLRAVLRQFRCPQCHNDYEAAMDDYIAIYFNVSPQIRTTRYQSPATLDPFDYTFHFRGVREGRRPNGAPYIAFHPRRAARHRVRAARTGAASFAFDAAPGVVAGVSADTEAGFALQITGAPVTEPQAGPPDLSRRQLRAGGADPRTRARSGSRSRTRPRSGSPWRSCSSRPAPTTSCWTSTPT